MDAPFIRSTLFVWVILSGLLGIVVVPSQAEAAKLVWQSIPHSQDAMSSGELFTDAVTFELGTFEVSFKPSLANIGQWASRWTVIDRTAYNPDTGFFASTVQFADNEVPYTAGRQVYMWGTTGGTKPEWILATHAAWEFPDAELGFPLTWNIADASQVVVGSIRASGWSYLMRTSRINTALLDPSPSPEQWLGAFFTEAELADETIGQLHSDPDGDGRDNLMEMALGTHPRVAEMESAIPYSVDLVGVSGFRYLRLTVLKPAIQQLRYRVEVSGDLTHWSSGPASTATLLDNVSRLSIRDKVAYETGRPRFIRLTVDL